MVVALNVLMTSNVDDEFEWFAISQLLTNLRDILFIAIVRTGWTLGSTE